MGLDDTQKGPFPVFTGISRVRKLRSGPKFHRLYVSWPYSYVKSLKKVGHLSLEIIFWLHLCQVKILLNKILAQQFGSVFVDHAVDIY